MARIDRKQDGSERGRTGGGYERLLGNEELGLLISKVQSAVNSSGTELERLIRCKVQAIDSLDEFIKSDIMPDGIFLANKPQIKKSDSLQFSGSEPDFIIFRRRNNQQRCHIVELKDGDNFDTKKAEAERRSMHQFIGANGANLPYIISSHFCCFNQNSREAIVAGFKNKITIEEAMTGREFCDLLEIDYDLIVEARKADQDFNLTYFVNELVKIPVVYERFLQEQENTQQC